LFCHREDEHDWQTANNKQRARNLHLDEFNDDDEKDATLDVDVDVDVDMAYRSTWPST